MQDLKELKYRIARCYDLFLEKILIKNSDLLELISRCENAEKELKELQLFSQTQKKIYNPSFESIGFNKEFSEYFKTCQIEAPGINAIYLQQAFEAGQQSAASNVAISRLIELLAKGFITSNSHGSANKYNVMVDFSSLQEMQDFHQALINLVIAEGEK